MANKQIHQLSGLGRVPTNTDVVAVDTGEATCQLSYGALASAILNALSASGMNFRVLSGSASNAAMAQSAVVTNGNNTELNGKTVALVISNNGISLYNQTDGTSVWNLPDPVTTAHGGTGATDIVGARTNLKAAYGAYASDSTWANLWTNHLSKISENGHALLLLNGDAASVLSNGKITGFIAAVVLVGGSSSARSFRIIAASDTGQYQYSWLISNANASSRTTGTVYRYAGTAI